MEDAPLELNDVECRVVGCLIEKSVTTPDDYPLTPNALMRACNQTTSRDPVVSYTTAEVEAAAESLKTKGCVRFVHMPSGRTMTKFRHVLHERLGLDAEQTAVIALLLLRGPQTPGELKQRSERLANFATLDAVQRCLGELAGRDESLVCELPRAAGQKEARWAHLLAGPVDLDALATQAQVRPRVSHDLEARVAALEAEVAAIRSWIADLDPTVSTDS